jgi:HK97 gp10 family phage protein
MEIKFTGVPALVRRMEDIRAQMVQKQARKAVRAGADVITKAMVERAPIGPQKSAKSTALEPGELKADIKTRMFAGEDGEIFALAGPGEKTAHVARFVEYGHRQVVGGSNKVTATGATIGKGTSLAEDVPAYPFLRPAYEATVQEAIDVRDEVLREGLKG